MEPQSISSRVREPCLQTIDDQAGLEIPAHNAGDGCLTSRPLILQQRLGFAAKKNL
jgi:hypothetical protein